MGFCKESKVTINDTERQRKTEGRIFLFYFSIWTQNHWTQLHNSRTCDICPKYSFVPKMYLSHSSQNISVRFSVSAWTGSLHAEVSSKHAASVLVSDAKKHSKFQCFVKKQQHWLYMLWKHELPNEMRPCWGKTYFWRNLSLQAHNSPASKFTSGLLYLSQE